MIMKNEGKRLQRCLDAVRGFVDEIIIVDTGSTDDSVAVARRCGARVLFDRWQDDFARPRNIGVNAAKCDWIFILDPDELVDGKDFRRLHELTQSKEIVAFRMNTRNYSNAPQTQNFNPQFGDSKLGEGFIGYVPSLKTRLFKNGLGFKFVGRFHELVDYSINPKKYKVAAVEVPVHHYPHELCQGSPDEKREFYLRIAIKKVEDDESNDQAWWELGVCASIAGRRHLAARAMQMSMRKGYTESCRLFDLSRELREIGDTELADFAFEKAICKLYPALTHKDEGKRSLQGLLPHLS